MAKGAKKGKGGGGGERTATEAEVRAAYEALTDAELGRLFAYADARAAKLGKRGRASAEKYTGEGLVKEALIRTLSGTKEWKLDSVPFMAHMIQAVRNISGHAREHFKTSEAELEVQATQEVAREDGREPLDAVEDVRLSPEEALLNKEEDEIAEKVLGDLAKAISGHPNHKMLSEVLSGWRAEMSGAEIKEALDLDQNQYETLQVYLLRTLKKLAKEGGYRE